MLKAVFYRDTKVFTKLGAFEVDNNGIIITDISLELKNHLLGDMPKMFIELPDPIIEELVEEVEVEPKVDLTDMTVAELRKFAKEHDIKLSATKKADIIEEILTEM